MTTVLTVPEEDTHVLGTGTLSLSIDHAEQDDLFRVAERRNPKRAFLFVSTVLGRHIPVRPDAHRKALKALAPRDIRRLVADDEGYAAGLSADDTVFPRRRNAMVHDP
jgi:hypothetical protein